VVKTYTTAESEGRLAIRRPGCRSARERSALAGLPLIDHDAAADKPIMSVGEEREILSPEITQIGRVRTRGSAIGAMNCDGNLARLRPGFLRRTTGSQVLG
jgi:hypothetical protein